MCAFSPFSTFPPPRSPRKWVRIVCQVLERGASLAWFPVRRQRVFAVELFEHPPSSPFWGLVSPGLFHGLVSRAYLCLPLLDRLLSCMRPTAEKDAQTRLVLCEGLEVVLRVECWPLTTKCLELVGFCKYREDPRGDPGCGVACAICVQTPVIPSSGLRASQCCATRELRLLLSNRL